MGLFKGAAKVAILAKVVDVVRREAAKPENQRKAKELFEKAKQRKGAVRRSS
jgi:hypothetical protein